MKRRALWTLSIAVALATWAPLEATAAEAAPAKPPPAIDFPPVTAAPTGVHLPGKVVWFDLLTLDPEAAAGFYGGLLGWTFEKGPSYTLAKDQGTPVAGLLRMPAPAGQAPQGRWVPLVSVASLEKATAAVARLGGKVLEGPTGAGARGRYAAVVDPRGAQLVLVESASGDPLDTDVSAPGWMWAELWTADPARSADFYKGVLGYEVLQEGSGKDATWVYVSEDRPRARAVRTPFERVSAQWLPYVSVADLNAALARVKKLGGRVLRGPTSKVKLAVVSDPRGAVMVLEERPEAPPLPEVALAAPATTWDPFGLEAAQRASQAEAASQAGAAGGAVAAPYAPDVPYLGLWVAPSPWWGWWGPGFWGPGWGGRPPWVGPPGWYRPPGYWPGYRPWPPGYRPPGYHPPGYRPVTPAPPRAPVPHH